MPCYLGTQHEKHISPGDSGKGSGKGCRTPANPGTASGLGNAQQAGHKGCRSCENPALNAPGSVRGCKANKDASPDGSQRLPLPWALPGGNHCWHPRALHTEINSALNSWLESSPAAPDFSCRNHAEEEVVGGGHSVAPTCPLNILVWGCKKRWVLLGSGEKSAVKQSLKVTCSKL